MSYYREVFGHREGQFPVCEDVAARSIALPFFPEMTEGQVTRVAAALGAVLAASPRHGGRFSGHGGAESTCPASHCLRTTRSGR